MKPLPVDVDGILEELGKYGKYIIWNFIILGSLPIILSSLHANNYVFSAYDAPFRCRIPECDGENSAYDQPWSSSAIPQGSKCDRYGLNSSWTDGDTLSEDYCPAIFFNQSVTLTCDEGYIFRDESSLVEELGILCDTWKRTLLGTLHNLGILLALPIIGTISDRLGRRLAIVVSATCEGILGIVKGLSVNYAMFAAMEIAEPTLGSGTYSSVYILLIEFLTPGTRVMGGCLVNIFFGTGQMLVGLLAWAIPYWRTYILVIYAPSFLIFFYYWLYDDSPRWLISKLRYQEAKDVLNKVAKTNGKTISSKALENLNYNIEHIEEIKNPKSLETSDEKLKSPWKDFFRSKVLILRVVVTSIWWITCTFCFYGLSINSAILPGNSHVNFIISASTEIPAHIMVYFGITYFGCKKSLFVCFLLGGASLLAFPFIPEDLQWLAFVCFFVGKLFVTGAFNGIYLYTSELFPTSLRHSLLALCSMVGRIGSISAPQIPLMAELIPELPAYLFSGSCLVSALLMLTSPETFGRPLPETVNDAENISSAKKIKSSDHA